MTTNISNLIAEEAKALARKPPETTAQTLARLARERFEWFKHYQDSSGLVVWFALATVNGKQVQKWFKSTTAFQDAYEKAKDVFAKIGYTGTMTVAVEGRNEVLTKLGVKR